VHAKIWFLINLNKEKKLILIEIAQKYFFLK
jgi:hypothetical protein